MAQRPRTVTGVAALVVVATLTAWALTAQGPPSPVPSTAPATGFSAERAYRHLERIAGQPTPIGTGNDEVRNYLVDQLQATGLRVEVQEGLGVRAFGASTDAGPVENVVATLPGYDPTGRVFLVSHYDTTYHSPGAADAKAAVAAILETARALTSGAGLHQLRPRRGGTDPRGRTVVALIIGSRSRAMSAAAPTRARISA